MDNPENKKVGLWIDHRKAVIVSLENKLATTSEVLSNTEMRVDLTNNLNDVRESNSEDVRDRHYGNHLEDFYDKVISVIRKAESIWIFGPGEAKVELENRLKQKNLGARIVGIATMDKMTNAQIAAKVRVYFPGK